MHEMFCCHLSTLKHLSVIISKKSLMQGKYPSFLEDSSTPFAQTQSEQPFKAPDTGTRVKEKPAPVMGPAPRSACSNALLQPRTSAACSNLSSVSTKIIPVFLPTPWPQAVLQGYNPCGHNTSQCPMTWVKRSPQL